MTTNLSQAPKKGGLCVKTYSLPYIESILNDLSVFDSRFQKNILEVRAKIKQLNEEIEISMFFYRLTFEPSSMNTNREVIMANLTTSYIEIEKKCKIIADKIDKILEA